jgi:pimeloyl-ACP methyl ester carboxylesterase
MPYVDVADIHLYYEEHGPPEAPALVLLHGGGGRSDDPVGGWALLIPTFASSWHVVAIDHRGHGRTDNPAGYQTFEQMGDDIAAVIRHLDVAPAHVAGISDGGVIAMDLALRRPELVRAIAVIGTNYQVDATTLSVAEGLDPDQLETAMPELAAEFAARHDGGKYAGYWKDLIRHVKDNNLTNPHWTVDDLRRLTTPALLIAGEDDPFANFEQMTVMRREIPNAEWLIVNHAGHAVHHEHPDFVAARIADFLARHPYAGPGPSATG